MPTLDLDLLAQNLHTALLDAEQQHAIAQQCVWGLLDELITLNVFAIRTRTAT
jgi:hypothetical protein